MGGPGSTRWNGHRKRALVEDSLAIDLPQLIAGGLLDHPGSSITVAWSRVREPIATGLLGFESDDPENRVLRVLVLFHSETPPLSADLPLVPLRPQIGGVRWFLQCPDCDRRALKLYVRPQGDRFGCRSCLGLTYRSAQEHNSRVDLARRDPEGFCDERERLTSLRSRVVTAFIADKALDGRLAPRRGRGWGRQSMTTGKRVLLEIEDLRRRALAESALAR